MYKMVERNTHSSSNIYVSGRKVFFIANKFKINMHTFANIYSNIYVHRGNAIHSTVGTNNVDTFTKFIKTDGN